ncbi:MAG: M10 family metallopeptidase C-terminal domain-containing protein, partial [Pseudomonadota bacterium]|nr:M10 family metallopeptidase C-terminal domain-containing protein [Pseudomonadota bacterium]
MASTNDSDDIDATVNSGDLTIDGLLTEYHWSSFARSFFAFAIPDNETDYEDSRDLLIDSYPDDNHNFVTTMPAFMVTGIRTAIKEYENILNFAIPESADNSIDTQLRYGLITSDTEHDVPPPAYAWVPQDDGFTSEQENWKSGDTFWNSNRFSVSNNPGGTLVGTYQYHTILHETGHALGLKHGHEAEHGNAALPAAWDSMEFTVMTYRSFVGQVLDADGDGKDDGYTVTAGDYAQTLMMLDIRALQHLYGVDFTTQSSDTVYRWDTQGKYFINGAEQWDTATNTIFLTIWDGGGVDTYDFSAFTTNQFIDLAPGRSSNLGTQLAQLDTGQNARGNVFNALLYNNDSRSLVENAIGGSGADTIQGNNANNRLEGGGGADDLLGLGGIDTLFGGAGADDLFGAELDDMLTGGDDGDLLNGGAGFDTAAYTSPTGETVTITPILNPDLGRWTVTGPAQAAGDTLAGIEAFV